MRFDPFVRKRLILVSSIGLLLITLGAAGLAWLFVKVGFAKPFFYVYVPGLDIRARPMRRLVECLESNHKRVVIPTSLPV